MLLKIFWKKVTNIGVDEAELGAEVVKVRLFNQLIFIALITSCLAMVSYFITNDSMKIIYTTLANIILESLVLLMAFQKKHIIARHIGLLVFPTLIAIHILVLGKNFGEANIFSAIALAAYFIYDGNKRLRIAAVIYITILFIVAKLTSIEMFNSHYDYSNPYDELVTFPATIIVLGLIVVLYQKSLKDYNNQRLNLIRHLEGKNQELAELNEELEQFTYIASHDLKSPLRTISSHLDLIRLHIKRNDLDAVDEDIAFAKKGTKQLYALISDILEYKELSNADTAAAEIDLNLVLPEVLDRLEADLIEKSAVINLLGVLPKVKAKERDLIVLFQNIIQNGIKYNESTAPEIIISSEITAEFINIYFKDNGIGIASEYHEKIFQFFKRLHTTEVYNGTGVGLGLCRKIVRTYKGDLMVSSAENEGAIFQIRFPINMLII